MNTLLATIVFCFVLFIYLHIYHHLKVSNDLEVYEVEYPSKERLEEICEIRQPALFDIDTGDLCETASRDNVINYYSAFDIYIRNSKDTHLNTSQNTEQNNHQLYVPLALGAANDLLLSEKADDIFSEKNQEFLKETSLINTLKHNDTMLRPPMVSKCSYDWLLGSSGTHTPFRYELDYRTYLIVTEGSVRIKLAPPKSSKYLYLEKDYTNFEFRSPIDAWEPQKHYKNDFNKVKCLEVELLPGKVFYLPAYWYYSIEFGDKTSLCKFSYQTYMGTLSIIHYHTLAFLQRNNTRDKVARLASNEIITTASSSASLTNNESITTNVGGNNTSISENNQNQEQKQDQIKVD